MNTLHQSILKAISDRSTWEDRQGLWYQMRHDGLRRTSKPFPGAADLHFPLIESTIKSFKPFFLAQTFSRDSLASFTGLGGQSTADAGKAEKAFDHYLRFETNFPKQYMAMTDIMLLRGRAVMKVAWCPKDEVLKFLAIDPINIIVAGNADELEEADWFCHVRPMTKGQYMRDASLDKDPNVIKQICGNHRDDTTSDSEKASREGLTYMTSDDMIIVWDVYEQVADGWLVHTYSPTRPALALRQPFKLPFKLDGKPCITFVSTQFEVKDAGWYSPRGIAEQLAPFEASLCKSWNQWHDFLAFMGMPLFTAETQIQNTANIRFRPGEILPPGIEPATMPPPPASLEQDMNNTRAIAEQFIHIPDFGVGRQTDKGRTATEINRIGGLMDGGVDLLAFIFRLPLSKLYRLAWMLMSEKMTAELTFMMNGAPEVLPISALKQPWMVRPSGSTDDWNRQNRVQKAVARFQLFTQDPLINQEELRKDVIAADNPADVDRLLQPTGTQAATEAEDEAFETMLLMGGYPAVVKPNEDHFGRLKILVGKVHQLDLTGAPVDPIAMQRMQDHIKEHLAYLSKTNPEAAQQIVMALSPQAAPGTVPPQQPQPQDPNALPNQSPV
jgi:hypothetical protein